MSTEPFSFSFSDTAVDTHLCHMALPISRDDAALELRVMETIEALTSTLIEHKKDSDEKYNQLSVTLAEIKSAMHYPEFAAAASAVDEPETMVYISPKGDKFHKIGLGSCCLKKPNLNELSVRKKLAVTLGREACKNCFTEIAC